MYQFEKALQHVAELGKGNFTAGNSCVDRVKTRQNLSFKKIAREAADIYQKLTTINL